MGREGKGSAEAEPTVYDSTAVAKRSIELEDIEDTSLVGEDQPVVEDPPKRSTPSWFASYFASCLGLE